MGIFINCIPNFVFLDISSIKHRHCMVSISFVVHRASGEGKRCRNVDVTARKWLLRHATNFTLCTWRRNVQLQ